MAKQDDWVRITVRIPPELHEKLLHAGVLENRSLNAEIIERLKDSFDYEVATHAYRDLNEEARLTRLNVELLKAALEMPSREEILKRMEDKKLEPMSPEGYQGYLLFTAAKQKEAAADKPRSDSDKAVPRTQRWK